MGDSGGFETMLRKFHLGSRKQKNNIDAKRHGQGNLPGDRQGR